MASRTCPICLTNQPELELKDCGHAFCKECLTGYIRDQFLEKKRSHLMIACPMGKFCRWTVDAGSFQAAADDDIRQKLQHVLSTVPRTKPTSLRDFNYQFDSEGVLRHMVTNERFHFINQKHYDAVGDLVLPEIYRMMQEPPYNLKRVVLPYGCDPNDPKFPKSQIFVSQDLETNTDKLMLLVQGTGAVRVGQWARALCINDSLKTGSILSYVQQAQSEGYSLVVFNPNNTRGPLPSAATVAASSAEGQSASTDGDTNAAAAAEAEAAPAAGESKGASGDEEPFDPSEYLRVVPALSDEAKENNIRAREEWARMPRVPQNETAERHMEHVFENIVQKSPAKHMVIVAHSAGGFWTLHLLNERRTEIMPRLRAIAFTDSIHRANPFDHRSVKDFFRKHCVDWVASDDPLDTPIPKLTGGAPCVSAGHNKHENTSAACQSSVFPFFKRQIDAFETAEQQQQQQQQQQQ